VLIGEFFESIFDNLDSLFENYKVEENDKKKIDDKIELFIDFLTKNIPLEKVEQKIIFLDNMIDVRLIVSQIQLIYYREKFSLRIESSRRREMFMREP
jgi:hypothetical protein